MVEEEAFWRQKARLKWAQDGDHNTKLFHTSVAIKIKHEKFSIARIQNGEGVWLETIEDIKAHATEFFSTLLTVDAAAPDVQAVDQMLDFIPSIYS